MLYWSLQLLYVDMSVSVYAMRRWKDRHRFECVKLHASIQSPATSVLAQLWRLRMSVSHFMPMCAGVMWL